MRLSLGTMLFGEQLSKDESFDIIDHFVNKGNYKFDTAQMYPVPCKKEKLYFTEEIIGEWLNSISNSKKSKIKVSTKFPNFSRKLDFLRKTNNHCISYKELKESIVASLKRLNLDSLETFFIHWPSRTINNFGKSFYQSNGEEHQFCSSLEETYTNLLALAEEGLCRNIGVSNESATGLHCLSKVTGGKKDIGIYIQNPYNLLNLSADINITEFCLATNIRMQAHSPLAFGILTGKYADGSYPKDSRRYLYPKYFDRYLNENSNKLVIKLIDICKFYEIDIIEIAYRYLLNNNAVTEIICGVKNIGQLDKALESIKKGPLPKDIYNLLFKCLSEYSITAW